MQFTQPVVSVLWVMAILVFFHFRKWNYLPTRKIADDQKIMRWFSPSAILTASLMTLYQLIEKVFDSQFDITSSPNLLAFAFVLYGFGYFIANALRIYLLNSHTTKVRV